MLKLFLGFLCYNFIDAVLIILSPMIAGNSSKGCMKYEDKAKMYKIKYFLTNVFIILSCIASQYIYSINHDISLILNFTILLLIKSIFRDISVQCGYWNQSEKMYISCVSFAILFLVLL